MTDRDILSQIEQLPDGLKQEVIDFIGYLSEKYHLTVPAESRKKKYFGKYRGSLKTGLNVQEVDLQLQKLRDEWERPIS